MKEGPAKKKPFNPTPDKRGTRILELMTEGYSQEDAVKITKLEQAIAFTEKRRLATAEDKSLSDNEKDRRLREDERILKENDLKLQALVGKKTITPTQKTADAKPITPITTIPVPPPTHTPDTTPPVVPTPTSIHTPDTTSFPPTPDSPEIKATRIANDKAREEYFNIKNHKPSTSGLGISGAEADYEAKLKAAETAYRTTKNELVKMFLAEGPEGKTKAQEFILKEVELKRKNDLQNGLAGKKESVIAGVSKGIEKWDNWGKAEGMKGYLQRLAKTGISMTVIAAISGLSVESLAKIGIGTASAVGGGLTSYLGRRVTFGLGMASIMAKVPDNKKKWVSRVLVAGSAGAAIAGGGLIAGGALVASSVLGLTLARLAKKYDKKIEGSVEKAKEGKIDLASLEDDVKKIEMEMEIAIRDAERTRMWGKIREGATAIAGSMVALEAFGLAHDYNQNIIENETPPHKPNLGKDIELKPDTAQPPVVSSQETIQVDHGEGGIQQILDIKEHIREHYHGDYRNAPKDIQELMSSDNNAIEYAERLGLYKPDESAESALLREGSEFKIDYKTGDISFHDATTGQGNVLLHGDNTVEGYKGDMFDSDPTPTPKSETPEPIDYSKLTSNEFSFANPEDARMAEERTTLETMYSTHEDKIAEIKADLERKYNTEKESDLMTDDVKNLNARLREYRENHGGGSTESQNIPRPDIVGKIAGNPFELDITQMNQANQIYQNSVVKIFGDETRWNFINQDKVDDVLKNGAHIRNDSGVMGGAYDYLHKLQEITGLKPQGNWLVGRENVAHYVARAIQHAVKEGGDVLDKVQNIQRVEVSR